MMPAITVIVASIQVCVVAPEAKLLPSLSFNGRFGWSVDVGPDRIVVGAPDEFSPLGGLQGVAYVFDRVGGAWVETAILADGKTNTPTSGDFGGSISLDGSQLAIGAVDADQAFVFKNNGVAWYEEAILHQPSGIGFGYAVDIVGDTLIVGDPAGFYLAPGSKSYQGRVHVYVRGPSGWAIQSTVHSHHADFAGERAFGWCVALVDDSLFIGSPGAYGASPDSGAVYVYERSGNTWALRQKLFAGDGGPDQAFGWSLAANSGRLAVGAIMATASTSVYSGAVYVFSDTGNGWIEQQKLISPSHTSGACIPTLGCFGPWAGISVAIDGGSLAFGERPLVHLFSLNGSRWINELEFTDPEYYSPPSNHGHSMAMHGTTLAIGAPFNPGVVYVDRIQGNNVQPRFYCIPKQVGHCNPRIFDVGQPSVSGLVPGKKYEIWAYDIRDSVKAMLFYSLSGSAATPFLGGTLCLNPPLKRAALVDTGGGPSPPCNGVPRYDFNAYIQSGKDPALVPGQQVWFQYWYREPSFLPPNNVGLTAGLSAVICQ